MPRNALPIWCVVRIQTWKKLSFRWFSDDTSSNSVRVEWVSPWHWNPVMRVGIRSDALDIRPHQSEATVEIIDAQPGRMRLWSQSSLVTHWILRRKRHQLLRIQKGWTHQEPHPRRYKYPSAAGYVLQSQFGLHKNWKIIAITYRDIIDLVAWTFLGAHYIAMTS